MPKKALRAPRAVPRRPPTRVLSDEAFEGLTEKLGRTGNQEHAATTIPVDCIEPDPAQPRKSFDDQQLSELAATFKTLGVLQPVVVRQHPSHRNRYILVMGERRWRAASRAGLAAIPAIIRDLPRKQLAQLVENLQRSDLRAMEIARSLKLIVDEAKGESQASIARSIGKDRAYVTRYLRLLELYPELQVLLEQGRCTDMQVLLALDQYVRDVPKRHARLKAFLGRNADFALTRSNLAAIKAELDDAVPPKPKRQEPLQDAVANLLRVTGVPATVIRQATELRIRCKSSDELSKIEQWLAGK